MKIEIYSGKYCPFCDKAKNLLRSKNLEFKELDVKENPDNMAEMQRRAPGARTIPQIFINDELIGGCDDLFALDKKKGLENL